MEKIDWSIGINVKRHNSIRTNYHRHFIFQTSKRQMNDKMDWIHAIPDSRSSKVYLFNTCLSLNFADQLHKKTFCFSCKETPIYGMKWTCTKCNINLCTQCYMGDYHDVEHIFERTVTSESRRYVWNVYIYNQEGFNISILAFVW